MASVKKYPLQFDPHNLVFDETYPVGLEPFIPEPDFDAIIRKINEELNLDVLQYRDELKVWGIVFGITAFLLIGLILSPVFYIQLRKQRRLMQEYETRVKAFLDEKNKRSAAKRQVKWSLVQDARSMRGRDVVNLIYGLRIEITVTTRKNKFIPKQQTKNEEAVEGLAEEEEGAAEAGSETSAIIDKESSTQDDTLGKRVTFIAEEESGAESVASKSDAESKRRARAAAGAFVAGGVMAGAVAPRRRKLAPVGSGDDESRPESGASIDVVRFSAGDRRASTGSLPDIDFFSRQEQPPKFPNKVDSVVPISLMDKERSSTNELIAAASTSEGDSSENRLSAESIAIVDSVAAGAAAYALPTLTEDEEESQLIPSLQEDEEKPVPETEEKGVLDASMLEDSHVATVENAGPDVTSPEETSSIVAEQIEESAAILEEPSTDTKSLTVATASEDEEKILSGSSSEAQPTEQSPVSAIISTETEEDAAVGIIQDAPTFGDDYIASSIIENSDNNVASAKEALPTIAEQTEESVPILEEPSTTDTKSLTAAASEEDTADKVLPVAPEKETPSPGTLEKSAQETKAPVVQKAVPAIHDKSKARIDRPKVSSTETEEDSVESLEDVSMLEDDHVADQRSINNVPFFEHFGHSQTGDSDESIQEYFKDPLPVKRKSKKH